MHLQVRLYTHAYMCEHACKHFTQRHMKRRKKEERFCDHQRSKQKVQPGAALVFLSTLKRTPLGSQKHIRVICAYVVLHVCNQNSHKHTCEPVAKDIHTENPSHTWICAFSL